MLSVRPTRISDESLASFVMRVAHRNGFLSPLDFLSKRTWDSVVSGTLNVKQIEEIQSLLPNADLTSEGRLNVRHSPMFQSNYVYHPRICVQCLKGSGYLKSAWSNITNIVCERHGEALVDTY
jgi:hypothetical protein